ncbi:MAG: tRNA 2-thiouridine(34) synthase MnmA [Acidobacteriia bacterium]|nr:tRNA 2-thiouridine(34) synthase MnmA [Terriglobia bacterium]
MPHHPLNSLGIAKPPCDTRVVVAMSGGVDSSVVAALLSEHGYDVVGITLQLYDYGNVIGRSGSCCAGADIYDARRVADRIGIPHYVLDYESRFAREVIDDFADTYLSGATPIPCIRCNQKIKFRDLLDTARSFGADALATGHYARREAGDHGPELHRAKDLSRDQSYFLFATTPDQLDFLRFPLGPMTKSEVRGHATRLGLPVAEKPDSQDICFVPDGDYARVVEKLRPVASRAGEIVHVDGRRLGNHPGIVHFTVGQRRGLGIGGEAEPLYVVRIEPETGRVVVGPKEALDGSRLTVSELNWLAPVPLGAPISVKLRSTQEPAGATLLRRDASLAEVALHEPRSAITPGQACVFYDGERVLGGGIITRPAARAA